MRAGFGCNTPQQINSDSATSGLAAKSQGEGEGLAEIRLEQILIANTIDISGLAGERQGKGEGLAVTFQKF